jgi:hypothetical protein
LKAFSGSVKPKAGQKDEVGDEEEDDDDNGGRDETPGLKVGKE